MKTVPYLLPVMKGRLQSEEDKTEMNAVISKEINGHQAEIADLINPNAPFRFMKIHTSLMEKEGILKNDIAVIVPGQIPINGKIVVAQVDETLMIRKYEKIKNGFLLHLNDQNIAPLKIEPGYENVKIIGVVAFIIKSM